MIRNAEGHRERLREKFLAGGAKGLSDREILELLLTYSRPRIDVRDISIELMDQFGGLSGVLRQPPEMLMRINGVGKASAVLLSLVFQAAQRALAPAPGMLTLDSVEKVREYLCTKLGSQRRERLVALLLDSSGRLLGEREIETGTVDRAAVSPRNLVEKIVYLNATSVILVHNHPGGRAEASREDRALTARLSELGRSLGFRVLDHFIVAGAEIISFRECGLMPGGD